MRRLITCSLLSLASLALIDVRAAVAAPPASSPVTGSQAPVVAPESERARRGLLLQAFREMPGLEAKFREEKHLALLTAPLVNEGTLHFASGMLARRTLTPVASVVLVRDGRLEVADRNGRMRIDLQREPVVALFVASFVEILAGDEAALERIYDVRLEGGAQADAPWRLSLTPKIEPMTKVVALVEIEGRGRTLTRMRVVERSGDETRTSFSDVDPARVYDAAAIARIFSTSTSVDAPPRG